MRKKTPPSDAASGRDPPQTLADMAWWQRVAPRGVPVLLNAALMRPEHAESIELQTFLSATNAHSLIAEGHGQRMGRKRGGEKTAKARKADVAITWQNKCRTQYAELISNGRSPRDVAALLATRFQKHPSTIRRVLK